MSDVAKPSRAQAKRAELCADILERLALGELLTDICREDGMPDRRTFWRWRQTDADLNAAYEVARREQAHSWADQLLAIANDGSNDTQKDASGAVVVNHDHIARSRLRCDSLKFLMSKHFAALYGDHQTLDLNVTTGLADEIEQGRQRAREAASLAAAAAVQGARVH